jgi:hypothetical protein
MNWLFAVIRAITRTTLAPLFMFALLLGLPVKAQTAEPPSQPILADPKPMHSIAPAPMPAAIEPPTSTVSTSTTLQGGFFKRFYGAYVQELHETGTNEPEPPRRIPPSPIDSPPFPVADWNYGGSSVIGATNTTNYPLMRALYAGPYGDTWKAISGTSILSSSEVSATMMSRFSGATSLGEMLGLGELFRHRILLAINNIQSRCRGGKAGENA